MIRKICFLIVTLLATGCEIANASNIVLDWNPSSSSTAVGYNVYYGTTSGIYSYKVNAGNVTSTTISNLAAGGTYYFVATAYDASGTESTFSSEISFTVPGAPTLTATAAPGGGPLIQFSAQTGHSYIIQASTDLRNWTAIWQSAVATSNSQMQFTDPNAGAYSSRFYRLVMN